MVFESLSYAWGKDAATSLLHIGNKCLAITRNLDTALRAARRRDSTISIWVDAICINQHDVSERNHQIQLMRSIYTSAARVNVWLGESFEGTNEAIALLNELSKGTSLKAMVNSGLYGDPSREINKDLRIPVVDAAMGTRLSDAHLVRGIC